jgi:tetratricopeptide (TPR) repeat protein
VFVDGFMQAAGGVVSGSTLRVLSSLVDKSLVQRRPNGRLSIHELVRQFAHAKLTQHGAEHRLTSRRHATYFASWLVRQREQMDRLGSIDAYDAVSAEWGNLNAAAPAWSLTIDDAVTSEAWARVLSARGDFAAVRNYVNGVLNQEGVLPDETQCRLLAYRGVANSVLGPSEAARADLMASIEKSRERNLIETLAFALTQLAMTAAVSEDSDWMEARLAEIAAVLPQVRDVSTSVRARYLEGNWLLMQGRTTEALQSYEQTIAFGVQHEASELQLATVKVSTANALIQLGAHARAESLLQEAVAVFERAGSLAYVSRALNSLACSILWQGATGRLPMAIQLAKRALTIANEIGYQNGSWAISDTLGQALWASGDRDEARRQFEAASQSSIPSARHDAQVHLGLLLLETGERAGARRIALDRLDAALASPSHLQILRAASLLAIAVILGNDAEDRRAITWLEALLSQSDLDSEHRRRAQALWQSVAGSVAVSADQTSRIDDGVLVQMREAVAALGES